MENGSNSYGTGRDPRRRGNHFLPVLFLILFCVAVHGLTHLYLSRQETPPKKDTSGLSLSELPTEVHTDSIAISDNCGLGLEFSDISEIQQRYWSLPDGVFVEQIDPHSIAYEAGLRSGDLLVRIEDRRITDTENCLAILEACCGEEELDLVYFRDGEERNLKVPMGDWKGE